MSNTHNTFVANKPMDLHIKHKTGEVIVFKHDPKSLLSIWSEEYLIHVVRIEGDVLSVEHARDGIVGQFPLSNVQYGYYEDHWA